MTDDKRAGVLRGHDAVRFVVYNVHVDIAPPHRLLRTMSWVYSINLRGQEGFAVGCAVAATHGDPSATGCCAAWKSVSRRGDRVAARQAQWAERNSGGGRDWLTPHWMRLGGLGWVT